MAIDSCFGIGLSDAISKGIINKTADFTFLFALALVQVPVALVYLKIEKQDMKFWQETVRSWGDYRHALIGSVFIVIGTGLLWIAFASTLASIASPITATSGVLVVLLAVIFMDEKMTLKSVLGMIFVLIGVIGLSLVLGG